MANTRPSIDSIPTRIKYYLLDYKDNNNEDYQSEFGTKSINDLTREDLKKFFLLAINKDKNKIFYQP